MSVAPIVALLLAVPSVEAQIVRALKGTAAGGARAVAATRPLVGTRYLHSPLGEGTGPDADPRFRLDAFDCMTFIETAVAFGSASSLPDAKLALDDIRYTSVPTLATRNHEVLSQWIPSNERKGWISDVTRRLAGSAAHPAVKEYTAASWRAVRAAGRSIPGLPSSELPLGRFEMAVVFPEDAPAVARRAPDGTLVFVVRADGADRPTRVTHAGLVLHAPEGGARIRHATSTRNVARVIEEPIERFLHREKLAFPRWPLTGFAFFAVLDASERIGALRSAASGPPPAPPAPRL